MRPNNKKRNFGLFLIILILLLVVTYSSGMTNFLGIDSVSLLGTIAGAGIGSVAGPGGALAGGIAGNLIVNGKEVKAIAPIVLGLMLGGSGGFALGGFLGGGRCSTWFPSDENKCGECNNNPLQPCNEYRCISLGSYCQYISEGQKCIKIDKTDFKGPVIEECQVKKYPEATDYGVNPTGGTDKTCTLIKPVQEYTTAVIRLEIDEFALCGINLEPGHDLDDGTFSQIGDSYDWEHYISYRPSGITQNYGKFYVRCRDYWGNNMNYDYVISFNLQKGKDIYGPEIIDTSLNDGASLFKGSTELDFFIDVSDDTGVAGCKYSKQEKSYGEMSDTFTCKEQEESGFKYWECSTKFTGLQESNQYYFVCKDTLGNEGVSYPFSFSIDDRPLQVSISQPSSGITLTDKTDLIVGVDGAYNDEAQCSYTYTLRGTESKGIVLTKEGAIYKDSMNFLDSADNGQYTITVTCDDEQGDEAVAQTNFVFENKPLTMTIEPSSGGSTDKTKADIKIITSGGSNDDGGAVCYYNNILIPPYNQERDVHKGAIPLIPGVNTLKIKCEDYYARSNIVEQDWSITFNSDALVIGDSGFNSLGGGSVKLYVETTGGHQKYGEGKCYYAKFVGRQTDPKLDAAQIDTSIYTNELDMDSGYITISSLTGKRYSKTITGLQTGEEYNFYVRCKDDIGFVTNKDVITIILQSSDVTPECTTNSDCASDEICSSGGYCINAGEEGDEDKTCQDQGGKFCDQGYQCVGDTIDVFYGSEIINDVCCASAINCVSYDGDLTKSCSEQNGNVCGASQICSGQFIDSSDAEIKNLARCCKGTCNFAEDNSIQLQQPLFYTSGGEFLVLTNKMAVCKVKDNNIWKAMTARYNNKLHSTPIRTDKRYNIRCESNTNSVEFTAVYS